MKYGRNFTQSNVSGVKFSPYKRIAPRFFIPPSLIVTLTSARRKPDLPMDIVLEVFDTFLFDRLYAKLLPAALPTFASNTVQDAAATTTTFSSIREMPTPSFRAASRFLQLEPSDFAYMSAWPRNSVWRQTLSLYLITWYRQLRWKNRRSCR